MCIILLILKKDTHEFYKKYSSCMITGCIDDTKVAKIRKYLLEIRSYEIPVQVTNNSIQMMFEDQVMSEVPCKEIRIVIRNNSEILLCKKDGEKELKKIGKIIRRLK